MSNYVKPQSPIYNKKTDNYIYPLTTADQVIMPDGSRFTNIGVIQKNYSVVGGLEEPSNPIQNMIWIQTETSIGKVFFSKNELNEAFVNGDIWIITKNDSNVAFNALRVDNEYMNEVYPIFVKQYIGSTWVDKTAQSYQNGEWVDWWNGELYDSGNQHESITGGWIGTQCNSEYTINGGVLTVNSDHLHFTNVSGGSFGVKTANVLDLTSYTMLHVLAIGMFGIVVADDFPSATYTYKASVNSDTTYTTPTELTVPISGIDSGRIAVTELAGTYAEVYKVWLS